MADDDVSSFFIRRQRTVAEVYDLVENWFSVNAQFLFSLLDSSLDVHFDFSCPPALFTKAQIAALICSGSSGQTATISAKSSGKFEMSILPCFWDFSGLSVHVCVHVSKMGNRNMLK